MMDKILVLGANPAWQKTLFFREFVYGEVNRAGKMAQFPSGKGINFCRAAAVWGGVPALLCQFAGGTNGSRLQNALAAEKISAVTVPVAGETRCCTTCLDEKNQVMTEIIEPSCAVSASEADTLLVEFKNNLSGAGAAAVCGTLPDGSDYRIYREAAEMAHAAGVPLLFDAWKELEPCLKSGRNFLKINREELGKLTGKSDLRTGLKALFAAFCIEFAAITDGAAKAFASDGRNLFSYTVPQVAQVVNPIGCGDTASAVMTSEIVLGTPYEKAFHFALCAASANCMNALPGSFDRTTAEKFAAQSSFECEKL